MRGGRAFDEVGVSSGTLVLRGDSIAHLVPTRGTRTLLKVQIPHCVVPHPPSRLCEYIYILDDVAGDLIDGHRAARAFQAAPFIAEMSVGPSVLPPVFLRAS
jgi:hypothetical protein